MFAVFFFLPFFLRKYVCRVLLLLMHTYVVRAPTIQFSVRLRIWWFRFFLFLPYTSAVPWLFYSFFFRCCCYFIGNSWTRCAHCTRMCNALPSLCIIEPFGTTTPHDQYANVVVFTIIMSNSRHLLDFVAIYLFYFIFFGCLSVRPSITHSHNNNISWFISLKKKEKN